MSEIKDDPEGKWQLRYICSFCGAPYKTKREAIQCWNSHSELTIEYVWGGIGEQSDFPVECVIKQQKRGIITKIASYELKEITPAEIRARKVEKKKKK